MYGTGGFENLEERQKALNFLYGLRERWEKFSLYAKGEILAYKLRTAKEDPALRRIETLEKHIVYRGDAIENLITAYVKGEEQRTTDSGQSMLIDCNDTVRFFNSVFNQNVSLDSY